MVFIKIVIFYYSPVWIVLCLTYWKETISIQVRRTPIIIIFLKQDYPDIFVPYLITFPVEISRTESFVITAPKAKS